LSLIPLINIWAWWQRTYSDDFQTRQTARIGVFLSAAYSLAVAIGIAAFARSTHPTGLVGISRAAAHGVVKIQTSQGSGTGFVIASRGNRHLILTNRHVIAVQGGFFIFSFESLEDPCTVTLRSGEQTLGYLAALPSAEDVDLALLVVESTGLSPLGELRRFESVQQGERVAAVGHPLGADFSITEGIISAKREGMWLQTSAPINYGNSGGPLLDQEGGLVGVNTAALRDEEAQGLGFAIRADYVLRRADWNYSSEVDVTELLARLRR
jgi:S1-C subfamily serine protease